MKSQVHNRGELAKLDIEIEKDVLESFKRMEENTSIPLADLVVIAMKRFKAAHSDYDPPHDFKIIEELKKAKN